MENAKRTYEVLNSELHDELPALYDSRVLFLVTNMQTLFAAEEVFHSETSKVLLLLPWIKKIKQCSIKKRLIYFYFKLHSFNVLVLKVYSELEAIIDKLAKDVQKGTLPKKVLPKPQMIQSSMNNINNSSNISNSM